jgi:RNA polymerase sigma-70 factor (ECF subfamily)
MYTLAHRPKRMTMNFETFNDSYVAKLRSGDEQTEAHFVRYFGELLDIKLRSRLISREIVQDLKQETFARVFRLVRSESGLRNAERLGPLVNSVCNHVVSEQYRTSKRVEPLEEEAAQRIPASGNSALDTLVNHDEREAVRRVLNELSSRDQEMLRSVFFEEADKDEVCRKLGVDRQYLRVLLHRAKNAFRTVYTREMQQVRLSRRGELDEKTAVSSL